MKKMAPCVYCAKRSPARHAWEQMASYIRTHSPPTDKNTEWKRAVAVCNAFCTHTPKPTCCQALLLPRLLEADDTSRQKSLKQSLRELPNLNNGMAISQSVPGAGDRRNLGGKREAREYGVTPESKIGGGAPHCSELNSR